LSYVSTLSLHDALPILEGVRKLQQDRSELSGPLQQIEARSDCPLVFHSGSGFVRKLLPELRGEREPRVGRHAVQPLRAKFRSEGLIERRVDLDRVEVLGQIGGFVEIARL